MAMQHEILQQLEDLRLAEWSDRAPPPPSVPAPGSSADTRRANAPALFPQTGSVGHLGTSSIPYQFAPKEVQIGEAYVNYPSSAIGEEPIYVPGAYMVIS